MITTVKFGTYVEANYWCKGAVFGGINTSQGAAIVGQIAGLVGQTITFTSPVGSCTFTQPTGTPSGLMQISDVKAQLEAAIPAIKMDIIGAKLAFYKADGSAACSLGAVNEGGRVPLGLANNEAFAGVLLNPPGGAKPTMVGFVTESQAAYITYDK